MNDQQVYGYVGKYGEEAAPDLVWDEVKETAEQQMEVEPSRFQAFADYAAAHRAMQDDILVRHLEREMVRLSELMKRAKYYYDEAMKTAEEEIRAVVLELRQTVEVAGVTASYRKGIARPSWKKIAVALKAPQELINEHTKIGKPSVRIKVIEEEQT